jgi:ribosomal protein S18 acetylase RimI-like enzyme
MMNNVNSILYRKLTSEDLNYFSQLIRLFEDVFEMKDFTMPDEEYLRTLLNRKDFMVFIATSGDEVVGGLTAYTLHQYYRSTPLVYIFDLAVERKYQRQGIGTQLIATINDYCRKEGVEEVFVQADRVDDYALDFYSSTGAVGEDVVHFYYPLNRP